MPTKAELTQEIYLLLAVIHVNGFAMSVEMAQRIFDRWPAVMGPRPESAKAIANDYNTILQQKPAEALTKTTKTPKTQKAIKNEDHDSPFSLARSKKKSTTISRVPKLEPVVKKEPSADPSPSVKPARNKEVIDLTDDLDDDQSSHPNTYPTRKRLCPPDFTSRSAVKMEEAHESGLDEKISDEFVAALLDETPSKKPKME